MPQNRTNDMGHDRRTINRADRYADMYVDGRNAGRTERNAGRNGRTERTSRTGQAERTKHSDPHNSRTGRTERNDGRNGQAERNANRYRSHASGSRAHSSESRPYSPESRSYASESRGRTPDSRSHAADSRGRTPDSPRSSSRDNYGTNDNRTRQSASDHVGSDARYASKRDMRMDPDHRPASRRHGSAGRHSDLDARSNLDRHNAPEDRIGSRRGATSQRTGSSTPGLIQAGLGWVTSHMLQILIVIAGIMAICGIAFTINYFTPIHVTVNDQPVEISGFRTAANAIEASDVAAEPGDLLAVDGTVLQSGAGEKYSVSVNGQDADDSTGLSDGDSITVARGADTTEEYTVQEEPARPDAVIEGVGAVHVIDDEDSSPGVMLAKTGSISGKTAYEMVEEPTDITCTRVNIDTGGEKVIALTFDDGPNSEYTNQILDVLAANGASATFFTVGDRITGDAVDAVKRAYSEGHQISTHSWDHAAGSGTGTNLSFMTDEEQRSEVSKGLEIIEEVTGSPASRSFRTPGGNFPESVIANVADLIDYEIGWNIDSNDWRKPGAAAIEASILKAGPGDIVLMHDGGGDRSQTVAGLRAALPKLKEQGYRFVTVDQLLEYL